MAGKSPTQMAKIGRNDPCPCGSGKKYKKCCEPRDVAAAAQQTSTAATSLQAVRGAMESALSNWISEEDDLDRVSNSVLDLIKEGKFDEAEQVGQVLLRDYPDVHDGFERLGMVFEARGNHAQARRECPIRPSTSSSRTTATTTSWVTGSAKRLPRSALSPHPSRDTHSGRFMSSSVSA